MVNDQRHVVLVGVGEEGQHSHQPDPDQYIHASFTSSREYFAINNNQHYTEGQLILKFVFNVIKGVIPLAAIHYL